MDALRAAAAFRRREIGERDLAMADGAGRYTGPGWTDDFAVAHDGPTLRPGARFEHSAREDDDRIRFVVDGVIYRLPRELVTLQRP